MPSNTYTHGHHESVLRSHRWRTAENSARYLLPRLSPADTVLDVGCGPGTLTVDLAARVTRVTALEATADALALCRETATSAEATNIDFVVGDACALPFADETFDVVHAHQVLQHLADPVHALREMWRITRPGGIVAVRDCDYAGFVWYPHDPRLDRWMALYQRLARSNQGEPNAGRRLLAWAHQAGVTSIEATSSTWCFADDEDRAYWGGMWAERVVRSRFADQAYAESAATPEELQQISDAWHAWAEHPDGWISLLHAEILATKPVSPCADSSRPSAG